MLLSPDSSTISVCLSKFPWARFRQTKGAVKLHLLLVHDGYMPSYAFISNGKMADIHVARQIPLATGPPITMDRAYNDYELFACWTESEVYFVTRLKDNADYELVETFKTPQSRNILSDQLIRFTGYKAHRKECPNLMRKVEAWDDVNNREIVLLSNHRYFGATTISSIYKHRWQIALFSRRSRHSSRA